MSQSDTEELFRRMQRIVEEDIEVLEQKGKEYGDSWKKRGGVGAFMMLARKWDRIEQRVSSSINGNLSDATVEVMKRLRSATNGDRALFELLSPENILNAIEEIQSNGAGAYDIFEHMNADTRAEGIADDIGDLCRYFLLVRAEHELRRMR